MFGKVLNDMTDYGCNAKTFTAHVDRMFVMCKHVFYNETWIDQGGPDSPTGKVATGNLNVKTKTASAFSPL
mgnify:CR=1 FL=1|jgi:hypothetical protein